MGDGYGDCAKNQSVRLGGVSGMGSLQSNATTDRIGTAGLMAYLSQLLEQVELKHSEITNQLEPTMCASGPEPQSPPATRPGSVPSPLNGALEVMASRLENLSERQNDVLRRLAL